MSHSPILFDTAKFLTSAPTIKECPPDHGAEVAFAGRSNAGKSSAINTLTRQTKLARTSKTPGRTQLLNFFALQNPDQRLVDLPGYGYAKVPAKMKLEWQENLGKYLEKRECLRGLVQLMDIRHPMQPYDTMMIEWAIESGMPVHILLTKADKLKRGPAQQTLFQVQKQLADMADNVSIQCFSSLNKQGIDELKNVLSQWLTLPEHTSDPI